jgi:hypothetical protein
MRASSFAAVAPRVVPLFTASLKAAEAAGDLRRCRRTAPTASGSPIMSRR